MEKKLELKELPELTFEEESHTYRLDGFKIPSVTEILKPLSDCAYGQVDPYILYKAAERGTAVHGAIETFIKYGFEDISYDLRPYFDAFKDWWGKHEINPVFSERTIYHKAFRYGGTLDFLAEIDGKLTLVDFKTTMTIHDMMCAPQLEAYARALRNHGICVEQKMILQLTKNGEYKERFFKVNDEDSWNEFLGLKIYVYDYVNRKKEEEKNEK